jgi:hypothetical protein
MQQQTGAIAQWPTFHITGETVEKLKKISPAAIDRYLKKDKEALKLKGKSLTKPLCTLKSRIPIRAFYSEKERKTPGFWPINTVGLQFAATAGRSLPVSTSSR